MTTGVAPPLLLRFVAAPAVPAVCDEVPRAPPWAPRDGWRRVTAAIVGRAGSVVRERNCHPLEGSDTDAQSDGQATTRPTKVPARIALSPIVVTNRISIGSAVRARSEIQQIER